jgi:ATP-binding cassette subfamily B protein
MASALAPAGTLVQSPPVTNPAASPSPAAAFVRMLRYLRPEWRVSALLVACLAVSALLGLVPPYLMRRIIDHAIPARAIPELATLVAAMTLTPLVAGVIGMWQTRLAARASQHVMLELRVALYRKLVHQSLRFFTVTPTGELLSRLQNDISGVQAVVAGTLVAVVTNVFVLATTLVVLFRMNVPLACTAVVVLPLFILPTLRTGRTGAQLSEQYQVALGDLSAVIQETLSVGGALLLHLSGTRAYELARFRQKATLLSTLGLQQTMLARWYLALLLSFGTIGPALIFLVGGYQIIHGTLTLGTVIAFVFYLARLYTPASALLSVHVDVKVASALFARIFEYLDLSFDVVEPAYPVRVEQPRGHLRFDNVTLQYEGGTRGVRDVSFEAAPGQMIGIVGSSGSGKTTLAYLASRLCDPTAGEIVLDGVPLHRISLAQLAQLSATVSQESVLLNGSIEANVRYGTFAASRQEVEAACRQAQIHEHIVQLPAGYETVVGERGYKLSGGEKQRLAVARLLLRDPVLVVLDEATSALDSMSEAAVQAALAPLLERRTSLVIAHRLSTIVSADLILVMEAGEIVERGTHSALLARDGAYARLYHAQQGTRAAVA